jgi:maltokinase
VSPAVDPELIAAARWYGGKGAAIAGVEEDDLLELDGGALRVLSVTDAAGGRERYLWLDDEDRAGGALATALVEGRTMAGRAAEFRFEPGPALAGLVPPGGGARRLTDDQTNTSYVVGERLVLKIYRRVEPGEHPEIEIGRFLTERAHVAFAPAFAGAVRWGDHALAMAQAFVPQAQGGWEWATGCALEGQASPFAALGAQTAALHAALREMGTRVAGPDDLRGWHESAGRQLDRALALVGGRDGELLRGWAPDVRRELAGLERPAASPVLARVHGDYHVGQILESGGELRVVDFEGEPGRPLGQRRERGTQLRDVAAMLRSFDHLARHIDRDVRPGTTAAIEDWLVRARAAFLDAYGEHDAALLRALEFEKETYEYVYAATFLPEWTHVATGGMRWLLEHPA